MTSHTETTSTDDLSFWTSRRLEFRVLILGRANAGKTTILERVAGAAISRAEVWQDGKLLPAQVRRFSPGAFAIPISNTVDVDDQRPEGCTFIHGHVYWLLT
jgi:GTPase SAR1 family protein